MRLSPAVAQMLSHSFFWHALYSALFAVLIGFIFWYGVDVPFGDDLYLVPTLKKILLDRTTTMSDLFVQNNEHIVLFPLLLTAVFPALLGWNMQYLLLFKAFLAGCSFFMLQGIARLSLIGPPRLPRFFLGLLTAFLSFSLTQWEIWSHSFTLNLYLATTAFIAAVYTLAVWRPRQFALPIAAVLCFVATFSASHGFLSWFAVLPLLKRNRALVWFFFALLTAWLYVAHYERPEWPPSPLYGLYHPLELLLFIFTFLGAPLAPHFDVLATVLGIVVAALVVFLAVHHYRRPPSPAVWPWFSIELFALLTALAISVGRVGFGVSKALMSRYIPLASLVLIPLMYVLYLYARHHGGPRLPRLLLMLGTAFLASQMGLTVISLDLWHARYVSLSQGKACLETYDISAASCLAKLGHSGISGEDIRTVAPVLEALGAFSRFSLPSDIVYAAHSSSIPGQLEFDPVPYLAAGHLAQTSRVMEEPLVDTLSGWAMQDTCQRTRRIFITQGSEHEALAHTVAVAVRRESVHTFMSCSRSLVWSVELPRRFSMADLLSDKVEAWVFDAERHQLLKLPLVIMREFSPLSG